MFRSVGASLSSITAHVVVMLKYFLHRTAIRQYLLSSGRTRRYLGISFGRPRQGSNDGLTNSVLEVAEKILSSKLTEWQKIEAVNMFAISKTDHFLHTSSANSSWADSLDSRIRKLVKKHLRLPVRTNCAFLHLSTRRGGLGLRSISQAWDRATITRASKPLSSSDRTVSDVAWAQLRATVQKEWEPLRPRLRKRSISSILHLDAMRVSREMLDPRGQWFVAP